MENWQLFLALLFMILMGVAMIWVGSWKILKRDKSSNEKITNFKLSINNPMFRLIAEYLIALSLISGAWLLYEQAHWGLLISLLALIALIYFSLKNLRWVSDENEEKEFVIPASVGFVGGAITVIILLLHFR